MNKDDKDFLKASPIFILMGLALFLSGAWILYGHAHFINGASTWGTFVEIQKNEAPGSDTYAAHAEFQDEQGNLYKAEDYITSRGAPLSKVGDHVKILYNVKNPQENMVDHGNFWNWIMPTCLLTFGVFLLVCMLAEYVRIFKSLLFKNRF